ncbi:DUF2017 domain-containing protein [Gordonia jinhuaensis]|uniref:DUF2017 domain-containing protein n=1 Tax=Gordonia jinhuaensis TaxID=1517702 RepID=A0A916X0N6_9ACTN|nr:DUF2017 domain-containing protein [Gordonia jinhuaensis]GGB44598.1 hypothetical protein GCM10011489_35060 [Gordonia jinhuaensis]
MRAWKRKGRGDSVRIVTTLDTHESELIDSLVRSMIELMNERSDSAPRDELADITGIVTGHSSPPADATLGRLLPDFHRPDQDATMMGDDISADLNGALRSMYEPGIIAAKVGAGQTVLDTLPPGGGPVTLSEQQAQAWLTAINDVRLALGAMLGIDENTPEEFPPDHPNAAHLDVYHWLTVVQELLVVALMGK